MARVVNMTILCQLSSAAKFNLKSLAEKCESFIYNPHVFTAVRYRNQNPRYTAALFCNGRVTLTGVKSRREGLDSINNFCKVLEEQDMSKVRCVSFKVANHVGTFDTKQTLNLNRLYTTLRNDGCTYETELFPGLIHPCKKLNTTITFFTSGKVNFTGFKRKHDIRAIQREIKQIVSRYKQTIVL